MNEERTPTTEEIREAYEFSGDGLDFRAAQERQRGEFDRWLAQHDAEVLAAAKPARGPRCLDAQGSETQRGYPVVCDRIAGHRGSHSYRGRWFWGDKDREPNS